MGQLFVISAPSGAGKTTLCSRLLAVMDDLTYSVSYTTRAPREGEADGRDYHFVTESRFRDMVENGEFLEWAEVFGRLYGTGRAWVESRLAQDMDVLVDVDVAGARQIKENFPRAVLIFILPPTLEELARRLRLRLTEAEEQIELRLGRVREEIEARTIYDYLVVNDQVDLAVQNLTSIIHADRARLTRMEHFWPRFYSKTGR